MRNYIFVILIFLLAPYLFYAQTENKNISPIFREAFKDFARVEKNLRKMGRSCHSRFGPGWFFGHIGQ
jgi:hypothetical protein